MTSTNSASFDIIVVGGGIAGFATALSLSLLNHRVIVLERTPALQNMGGSILIPPNAARVLHSYGVWERFKSVENPSPSHTIFRYSDGKILDLISHKGMIEFYGYE